MKTPRFISIGNICIAVLLFLMMPIGGALAADIMVDADCSLPNAVLSANGEGMVEPLADCEAGDADDGNAQVDDNGAEIPAGLDTITIDVAGTVEGVITLDASLTVSSNIVMEGSGFAIDGAGNQIFNVTAGSLTVHNLTMSGGWSAEHGGAIAVTNAAVTLNNSVVSGNSATELGGGIYALDSDLALIDSVVSGNAAGIVDRPEPPPAPEDEDEDDSAQPVDADEEDASAQTETSDEPEPTEVPITWDTFGAGVYFEGEANSLTIDKSGLDTNVSPSNGGGVYIASGNATINNSTISGNSVGGDGGGVYNAGDSTLTHVTVVGNSAMNVGGIVDNTMLLLYNSIVADNAGGDCFGTLNATIGNLIRDLSCGHDGLSDDPILLLLGGSPEYYLPQAGSPALDAAHADYCLPNDQRGIDRVAETCDIGAAEHQPGVFKFQIQSALAILSPPEPGGSIQQEEESPAPAETPEPTAVPSTCESLPSHISVTGTAAGTECRLLDEGGVGNQTLIDYGFYYAIDIYGSVPSAVKACFQHNDGAIVLLDAANSPRNIVPLRTRHESNLICADVNRPGSVVLMPIDFFTSGVIAEPIWELSGCTVTTTDILNLRSEPSSTSSIVANVLNDVQLTASQQATHYHRVNYYGIIGWLSSSYLSMSVSCE